MRNKLRRIIINKNSYIWGISYKYQRLPLNDYKCITYFKAYINEGKNTPLIFKFETLADYIYGNTLNTSTYGINLNCPRWTHKLIVFGITNGWNGKKKVDLKCSYELLKRISD